MKITTGVAKGRKIKVPKAKIAPTKEMVRQAIFSILGDLIVNKTVADLYAGSGSLGLEALSRGAERCDFVDKNEKAVLIIKNNLQTTHLDEKGKAYKAKVDGFLETLEEKRYDLVFADPPYEMKITEKTLNLMKKVLKKRGLLILEHAVKSSFTCPTFFKVLDERVYGQTKITFLTHTLA